LPFHFKLPLESTDNIPVPPVSVSVILTPPYPTKLIGKPESPSVDIYARFVDTEFVKTSPIVIYPVVSPICRRFTVNVDTKPNVVEIELVEILHAVMKFVLTVFALITCGIEKEPPPPGTLVNSDPSPINLARIVAAEIVVKNPKLVEIELVEILDAVIKLVLTVLALINAGIENEPPPPPGTFVNSEPSPTNLA
jgi:hypothetical protein